MAARAATPELGEAILAAMAKADRYYGDHGPWQLRRRQHHGRALARSRRSRSAPTPRAAPGRSSACSSPASGRTGPGLYLMDMVNDGAGALGLSQHQRHAEVIEMIACGCHMILFSTGRGSVVGLGDRAGDQGLRQPRDLPQMAGDMDVDAGRIVEGRGTLDEVGERDRRS